MQRAPLAEVPMAEGPAARPAAGPAAGPQGFRAYDDDVIVLETIDRVPILYIKNGILYLNNTDDAADIGPGHVMYMIWMNAFSENSERDMQPHEFVGLMQMHVDHMRLCIEYNVFRGTRVHSKIDFD